MQVAKSNLFMTKVDYLGHKIVGTEDDSLASGVYMDDELRRTILDTPLLQS